MNVHVLASLLKNDNGEVQRVNKIVLGMYKKQNTRQCCDTLMYLLKQEIEARKMLEEEVKHLRETLFNK
ncbi:hypothetical protein M3690_04195 [Priestia megaterium]|uniref:hypothetical protein n=1 Tax=Priestia megaterium TaxID=1404 RepID=UPI00203C9CC5|nr:hypothetical protein [Priestia megaterium]MCM3792492.1 hypothetical protein [Priestia megaterium]